MQLCYGIALFSKQIKDTTTFKKLLKRNIFNGYYCFGIAHEDDIYFIICIVCMFHFYD